MWCKGFKSKKEEKHKTIVQEKKRSGCLEVRKIKEEIEGEGRKIQM